MEMDLGEVIFCGRREMVFVVDGGLWNVGVGFE